MNNIKFSDKFNDDDQDEKMAIYTMKTYIQKLEEFIKFYKKYEPKGIRIIGDIDMYEESKSIFDDIISGEVYIDEVFSDPDNPLRNIVMLLHIDEPKLIKRTELLVQKGLKALK